VANDRIVSDPAIMLGKPCVAGTRITVEHILRELAAGSTVEQLLQDYPRLNEEDVRAALTFAARAVELERVYAPDDHAA
jgi:uncharacterized protein (DUF433 family)